MWTEPVLLNSSLRSAGHFFRGPLRDSAWPFLSGLCFLVLGVLVTGPVQGTPDIQQWTTQRGSRVYFVPTRGLPVVDVRVAFDAGSARDQGKPGLARLTNGLLDEGAGAMDANEVAERLEAVGARLEIGAKRDMAWAALRSLSDPAVLDQAAEVVSKVLGQPRFDETALERERQRMLVVLGRQEETSAKIAEQAFFETVFRGHPYASPQEGSRYGLRSISRNDVELFHQTHYTTGNAVVAIVGDLDLETAERLADRLTGKLQEGPRRPLLPDVEPLTNARTLRIDHPSTQTHVFIGEPAMSRTDPDYFPLYVGNHILGGAGLVSRLSQEIRERRGMSYSVYCWFLPMERQGPFLMGLQTENQHAGEAIFLMSQALARFVNEGPTEEELLAAKKNITGGFALRLESNDKIAKHLAMIGFYELPLDYLETFSQRVDAVDQMDVVDAFQRRLNPERMVTVIVGGGQEQGEARLPSVKPSGLGAVARAQRP